MQDQECEYSKSFLIQIDGSGKIDYSSSLDVLDALVNGARVAIGCRHKQEWAISDERAKIELFENFLVSEKYFVELPDAQCGCWGLRFDVINNMALTANNYEIELDVISSALEAGVETQFVPITINTTSEVKTDFVASEEHFKKLIFLSKKLSMDEFDLRAKYEKFSELYGKLPQKYLEIINKVSHFYFKDKPKCVGGCDGSDSYTVTCEKKKKS